MSVRLQLRWRVLQYSFSTRGVMNCTEGAPELNFERRTRNAVEFKDFGVCLCPNELNCRPWLEVLFCITRSLDSEQAPCQPRRFTTCIKSTGCQVQLTLGQPERLAEPRGGHLFVLIVHISKKQWLKGAKIFHTMEYALERDQTTDNLFGCFECQDTGVSGRFVYAARTSSTKKVSAGPPVSCP